MTLTAEQVKAIQDRVRKAAQQRLLDRRQAALEKAGIRGPVTRAQLAALAAATEEPKP